MRTLTRRMSADFVLASELAWEAHDKAYWQEVQREDGTAYDTEEAFFEDVLHVEAFRSAARRIAIGRMLAALPEPARDDVRAKLAGVGVTKAEIVVPMLEAHAEDPIQRAVWLDRAQDFSVRDLQQAVNAETGSQRPRNDADDNERLLSAILKYLPPETREEVRDVFIAGMRLHDTAKVSVVFLYMVKEVKAEWFRQVWGETAPAPAAAPPKGPRAARAKTRKAARARPRFSPSPPTRSASLARSAPTG